MVLNKTEMNPIFSLSITMSTSPLQYPRSSGCYQNLLFSTEVTAVTLTPGPGPGTLGTQLQCTGPLAWSAEEAEPGK